MDEHERLDILQWAKQYARYGLSVIPVFYGEKKPLVSWQAYQRRKATESELHEWFGNSLPRNIGIVCGHVSGNIVVLDFDKPEAYQRFFGVTAKLESETPVVRTCRGLHVWLRTTNTVRSYVLSDLSLDVIGESKFVLAPPSRHPSGITYEFVNDIREPMIVDDFDQAILRRCKALGARIPKAVKDSGAPGKRPLTEQRRLSAEQEDRIIYALVPFWKRGQRSRLCMYLLGLFIKRGILQEDAEDVISRICDTAADEEKAQRLSQVSYHYGERRSLRLKGISGLREVLTFE